MSNQVPRVLHRLGIDANRVTPTTIGQTMRSPHQVVEADNVQHWCDQVSGLGPLAPLVRDEMVTDILVNTSGPVWVDRGSGLENIGKIFAHEAEVRQLATRLAQMCGRRLDDSVPWVDGQLPAQVRLHAIIPPLSPHGTHISLRIQRSGKLGLAALRHRGFVTHEVYDLLKLLIEQQVSFLISGGTGSGKTTLLAALLDLVPTSHRIVLVEDAAELDVPGDHVVSLVGRPANPEGKGRVGLGELVRQALRMRPDRIVLGECRGPEIQDLLNALNTGHRGGCATLHANSIHDIPRRIHALGSLAGMSDSAVSRQLAGALQVALHVSRNGGVRRLEQIGVVNSEKDVTNVASALLWDDRNQVMRKTAGWPKLASLLGYETEIDQEDTFQGNSNASGKS